MMRSRTQSAPDARVSPGAAMLLEWGVSRRPHAYLLGPGAVVDLFSPYAADLAVPLGLLATPPLTYPPETRAPLEVYAAVKKLQARPAFAARGLDHEQYHNERTAGILRGRGKEARVDLIDLEQVDLDAICAPLGEAIELLLTTTPHLCLVRMNASDATSELQATARPIFQLPDAAQAQTTDPTSTLFWRQLLERLVYALTRERAASSVLRTREASHWKKA